MVIHGTVLGYKHCPILVHYEPIAGRGNKLFRFEAFWSKRAECREIVKCCWANWHDENSLES